MRSKVLKRLSLDRWPTVASLSIWFSKRVNRVALRSMDTRLRRICDAAALDSGDGKADAEHLPAVVKTRSTLELRALADLGHPYKPNAVPDRVLAGLAWDDFHPTDDERTEVMVIGCKVKNDLHRSARPAKA